MKGMQKILNDGERIKATHYHKKANRYYRFNGAADTAKAYLSGKWEECPLYPSIISLSDIREFLKYEREYKNEDDNPC